MTTMTMFARKGGIRKDCATEDFHYQFENHDNIADNQYQLLPDHVDSTLKEMAVAAPHYGPSNVVEVLVECDTGDNIVNRSASGGNNWSNRINRSSTAVDNIGTIIERGNGIAGNNGSVGASGSQNGSGNKNANKVDQNKTPEREASLSKFHRKRKESCIDKKVQLKSRKKLAEQWSHFCGQFLHESTRKCTRGR